MFKELIEIILDRNSNLSIRTAIWTNLFKLYNLIVDKSKLFFMRTLGFNQSIIEQYMWDQSLIILVNGI